jgi:hypothetical protein
VPDLDDQRRPPVRGTRRRGPRRGRRPFGVFAVLAVNASLIAGVLGAPAALATSPSDAVALAADLNPDCLNDSDPVARADELMARGYRLTTWPLVTLPADLKWTEDPFHDTNWQFQFHSMRYVLDLFTASRMTGNPAYRDRGLALLREWARDNPRIGAPSIWSWNDHSTALRAVVLACAADLSPMTSWLHDTLAVHGATLADPAFYVKQGNHALNQAIGLLEIGRVLKRSDWVTLAASRINSLLLVSVDAEGVTNEQSVGYEYYNYVRYSLAKARLVAVGQTPSSAFARVALMPAFMAQATLPNGRNEMIGDTADHQTPSIPGTDTVYAASRGTEGTKPTRVIAKYAAGYLFVRSGWGGKRSPANETFLSAKWGAGPIIHGHADGLQLTLAAYGSRLLVDPGLYSYTWSAYRGFFKGRDAHNIVTVDGLSWNIAARTSLLGYLASSTYVDIRLRASGYSGVTHTRRITYSRRMDYLVVDDQLASTTRHTYRQLWHFTQDAHPTVGTAGVMTQRRRGNVLVRQLVGAPQVRIVGGRTSPVQGWISYTYGVKVAATVEEAIQTGTNVRYVTLIVPAAGRPNPTVSGFRATSTGYTITVTIGTRAERLTVSGTTVTLTPLS